MIIPMSVARPRLHVLLKNLAMLAVGGALMMFGATNMAVSATVTEDIVFAMNEDYAAVDPAWQTRAQEIVDHVNETFAKNTVVQFRISSFKTYPPSEFTKTTQDRSFYQFRDNGSYAFGTTIFYFQPIPSSQGQVEVASGNYATGAAYFSLTGRNPDEALGKLALYNIVAVFGNSGAAFDSTQMIKGKSYLDAKYGDGTFAESASALVHELGHSFGLGIPEGYFYDSNVDNSGIAPALAPLFTDARYGAYDPMFLLGKTRNRFIDYHAAVINDNVLRQNTLTNLAYYANLRATSIRVAVRNGAGDPVPGATVRVYGSRSNCRTCSYDPSMNNLPSPLLQTVTTDQSGNAFVEPTVSEWKYTDASGPTGAWVTKIVKVTSGTESKAAYVTTLDLQMAKKLQNADTYEMPFVIGGTSTVPPSPTPAPAPAPAPPPADATDAVTQREASRFVRTDTALVQRLSGRILLQVEEKGEAWWLDPVPLKRRYMGRPADAFALMRAQGLGISNADLRKIPVVVPSPSGADSDGDGLTDALEAALGTDPGRLDTDGDGYSDANEVRGGYDPLGPTKIVPDDSLIGRLLGRILLQVESRGEAWYVNPVDKKRYFLGRPDDAFALMRNLGLGISNRDLNYIPVATQ